MILKKRFFLLLMMLTFKVVNSSAAQIPIFTDMKFTYGFMLSYPDSSWGRQVEAVLNYDQPDLKPCWRLCQWGTKYSLADVNCVRSDANYIYENKGKKIVVSDEGKLVLDIRGSAEYGDSHRKPGESWPHILIEQDAVNVYRLDELDSIRFEIDVRLLHCVKHMSEEQFNPGLHTAHIQIFFIVKNINPNSGEQGGFFWFGVPFFDYRYKIPPQYMAKDIGKSDATGKFIYTVAGDKVGVKDLRDGHWLNLQVDLLPYIKNGVHEAVKRGYLKSLDIHDYAVVNMNLGWEIPGTFDAAAEIRGLNVFAITKNDGTDSGGN